MVIYDLYWKQSVVLKKVKQVQEIEGVNQKKKRDISPLAYKRLLFVVKQLMKRK